MIRGRVQGVFFRASTQAEAVRLGLTGWVRNLPDGRVEVLACGDPEDLERLREWLAEGPEHARVDDIELEERPFDDSLSSFGVR